MVSKITAHGLINGGAGTEHLNEVRRNLKTEYGCLSGAVEFIARRTFTSIATFFGLSNVRKDFEVAISKDNLPKETLNKIKGLADKILKKHTGCQFVSLCQKNTSFGTLNERLTNAGAAVFNTLHTEAVVKDIKSVVDSLVQLEEVFSDKSITIADYLDAVKEILKENDVTDGVFDQLTGDGVLTNYLIEAKVNAYVNKIATPNLAEVQRFINEMEALGTDKAFCEVKAWEMLTKNPDFRKKISEYKDQFSESTANQLRADAKQEVQTKIDEKVNELDTLRGARDASWIALQRAKATFILGVNEHLERKDTRLTKKELETVKKVLTSNGTARNSKKLLDNIMARKNFGITSFNIARTSKRTHEQLGSALTTNLENYNKIKEAKEAHDANDDAANAIRGTRGNEHRLEGRKDRNYHEGSPLGDLVKQKAEAGEDIVLQYQDERKSCDDLLAKLNDMGTHINEVIKIAQKKIDESIPNLAQAILLSVANS